MARTVKRGYDARMNLDHDDRSVRSYYSRETGWVRKDYRRKARRRANEVLATARDPEDVNLPKAPRTGGWLSH